MDTLRELLSPSFVWRMSGVTSELGRDDFLKGYEERRAFSDFSFTVEDEIVEDDRVTHRWTIQMRHMGTPSGDGTNDVEDEGPHALTFTTVWVYRVVDRKVVEAWSMDDALTG